MTTFVDLFRKHVVAFRNDPAALEAARVSFDDLAREAKEGPASLMAGCAKRAAAAFVLGMCRLDMHATREAPADPGALMLYMNSVAHEEDRTTETLRAAVENFALGTMAEQLLRAQQ